MENQKSNRKRLEANNQRKYAKHRKSLRAILRSTNKYRKMQKAIKKAQKEKTGISKYGLLKILHKTKNLIGVFAEDQLQNLSINSFPSFLVVNLDSSFMRGSHWIALRISAESIEIFDPLGFQILNWPRIPCHLLRFLQRWSAHRRTYLCPVIQSKTSVLCGYFCIIFIICRQFLSFNEILSNFKTQKCNDNRLIKLFL